MYNVKLLVAFTVFPEQTFNVWCYDEIELLTINKAIINESIHYNVMDCSSYVIKVQGNICQRPLSFINMDWLWSRHG